jgi:hypothetical protein
MAYAIRYANELRSGRIPFQHRILADIHIQTHESVAQESSDVKHGDDSATDDAIVVCIDTRTHLLPQ